MQNRFDRKIIIGLILATTLPFLLLFINLSEVLPITNSGDFWAKFVFITANVSGLIGTILLVWSFLLGIRSLVLLITPDLIWVLKVHKWIGKYGLLLVFVHPILEMIYYLEGIDWLFVPNLSTETQVYITVGRFAFILFLVIYLTSAVLRSRLKYRPWLYIHYLSYPMLFLTFLHANSIGTYLNKYLGLKTLWFALLFLFQILVIYRIVEWAGWLKPKYKVISKSKPTENIVILVFQPAGRSIKAIPGQFIFMQIKHFGESHPFSVMEFDENTGQITIGIKTTGIFTKKMEYLDIGSRVMFSGPFGIFTREAHNDKPKVLIAGGIGITPFVDVINKFCNDQTILLYSNKLSSQILFHDKFKTLMGLNYTAFVTQEEGVNKSNIVYHRIDKDILLRLIGGQKLANNYQYFLCGSPDFITSMVDILKSNKVNTSQIYTEKFSY
ncbi:MAG: ferric reductase-like transmembrane domain-containing protein [candidate division SR1 bacterium]|nr:ferric reductase-like transmembrane domain-containing protein [candidate division SR1 bacterium]